MTIKRLLWALPLVLAAWIAVMAGVMRFAGDVAPAAVVPWPGVDLIRDLPQDVAILGISPLALTVANTPDLTQRLYEAGAWLVLPAGLTGCIPLTKSQRDRLIES